MRVAKTFSLTLEAINSLQEYTALNKIDPNKFMSALILKVCKPKMLECKFCGAKYSVKSLECPGCKLKEQEKQLNGKKEDNKTGVDMPPEQDRQTT